MRLPQLIRLDKIDVTEDILKYVAGLDSKVLSIDNAHHMVVVRKMDEEQEDDYC